MKRKREKENEEEEEETEKGLEEEKEENGRQRRQKGRDKEEEEEKEKNEEGDILRFILTTDIRALLLSALIIFIAISRLPIRSYPMKTYNVIHLIQKLSACRDFVEKKALHKRDKDKRH